jgi:hypothetical protein
MYRSKEGSRRIVLPVDSLSALMMTLPRLILKLKTNDGYEVAFLLDEGMAGSLGHALLLSGRQLRRHPNWVTLLNAGSSACHLSS